MGPHERLTLGAYAARSAATFVDPARDLAGIGACLDAQLRGEQMPCFVQVAFMETDFQPSALSQQVAAASCYLCEFG